MINFDMVGRLNDQKTLAINGIEQAQMAGTNN